MARKKIVFVIVEGPSDDTALGVMFNRLYDRNLVHIEITHGDITTRDWAESANIASRIGNLVKLYAAKNHFKATDFQEVIHLVDTDGVFIPPEAVVEDSSCTEPFYTLLEIRTANPDSIRKRNVSKSKTLSRMIALNQVWKTIPYHVFFFSCCLDHVLHNKQNSNDTEKEADAYAFAKHYRNHIQDFLNFICDSDFSVKGDYKGSWTFIATGLHSLERHSNLGICLESFRSDK